MIPYIYIYNELTHAVYNLRDSDCYMDVVMEAGLTQKGVLDYNVQFEKKSKTKKKKKNVVGRIRTCAGRSQ